METLSNGFSLALPEGVFPLSTDSMVLSHFVRIPRNANILDLGSGGGTLGLLLCAKDPDCTVTGLEIDPAAHRAAQENIRRNGLSPRLTSICADLRSVNRMFSPGSFHSCVSNPPYFSGGAASQKNAAARRDDHCSPGELFSAAAWALRYGGDFFLVHKPEKLAQLCVCAGRTGLEPKRLTLLRHRPGDPVSLILLQCRKGGKPGLSLEEWSLFDAAGTPTKEYCQIYHR